MEVLHRAVGPIATNLYVLGDEASREAIAIDTATPCVGWLTERLAERGWTLKLIVSSHW
ncbi:MAG: MBL fold metallo-hydrolase, partial [Chloroflexi bacterium]|nr:MBL fold metallo-hydrolase [Chloroflexota bacterium]